MDKTKFLDDQGRPLTQSLFLEINYDEKYAVYTLKGQDHNYKGTVYPSLKKLYLEMMDPTEYLFATKHLYDWNQWQRITENVVLRRYVDEWRLELEYKLRAHGFREVINQLHDEKGSFQAAKFLVDRGWDKRGAGRPSKEEKERLAAQDRRLMDDYGEDFERLSTVTPIRKK